MDNVTIRETYTYTGCGFPVLLLNAPFRETSYGPVLDLDTQELSDRVLAMLAVLPGRLTGKHVRFCRHHMDLTQEVFADLIGVDQSAVAKWEAKGDAPTAMPRASEMAVRIQMLRYLKRSIDAAIDGVERAVRRDEPAETLQIAV